MVYPNETLPGMAGPEGVAVHGSGDVFWSEYGKFGGNAADSEGRGQLEGIALKAGQIRVKRARWGRGGCNRGRVPALPGHCAAR